MKLKEFHYPTYAEFSALSLPYTEIIGDFKLEVSEFGNFVIPVDTIKVSLKGPQGIELVWSENVRPGTSKSHILRRMLEEVSEVYKEAISKLFPYFEDIDD